MEDYLQWAQDNDIPISLNMCSDLSNGSKEEYEFEFKLQQSGTEGFEVSHLPT